jgi:SAM-dependent methyltransferase
VTASYLDAAAWTAGPQVVYDRMAARAVDSLGDVSGLRVLDAGAGTGGATRALLTMGAMVAAVDLSTSMLAELNRQTGGQVPTTVADIRALPMADSTYDAAVAAFVINHFDDPATAVAELRRVTRPGGVVVATTFGTDDHPIKPAVDEVLAGYGFVPPEWYLVLKYTRMPLIATSAALSAVGRAGGLSDVTATLFDVDLGDLPAEVAASYRLGLSHIVPFVESLDTATQAALVADVIATVRALPPLRLPMLVLRGIA